MTRRQLTLFLVIDTVVVVALAAGAYFYLFAPAAPTGVINTLGSDHNIAIRGTDPVAYFTEGAPVAGNPEITAAWQGATWQFSTVEHRDLFLADPEKYAPVYGGYCAFGVAKGSLVKIEPEVWRIHDGRLYLNFNLAIGQQWAADIPGFIAQADANWPQLAQEAIEKTAATSTP